MSASTAIAAQASAADSVSALKGLARRGLATLALRYGVVIAINLLGTVVLSRLVGPAVWGIFAIAQVFYMGSQEILGRGAASYLIKKAEAPSPSDLKNAFAFQHLLGVMSLVIAGALAFPAARWYDQPSLAYLLLAAAIAAYGCAWRSIPVAMLERELDYLRVALIEVFEAIVFSGVAIGFALKGYALPGLGVAIALRSLLPTVLSYAFRPAPPALVYDRRAASGMTDFGFFIFLGSIFNIGILFVPVIFVGKLAGPDALGEARMAFSLYSNLLFFTAAVLRLSFSSYSRLAEYPGELQLAVRQNLRLLAALLSPAVALFAGLAAVWVPVVFGPKWPNLPLLLLIMAPAQLVTAVFWGILNPAMIVAGKQRAIAGFLAVLTLVYAASTWLLTIWWDAYGVAVALSLSYVSLFPFLFRLYRRTHGPLHLARPLIEITIGTCFMLALWFANGHVGPIGLLCAAYVAIWSFRNSDLLKRAGQLMAQLRVAARVPATEEI